MDLRRKDLLRGFGAAGCLLATVSCSLSTEPERDYAAVDEGLKVVLIDSDPRESFLGLQLDSAGRLFVGGREALFVYEPDEKGGYQSRQELYRFPDHTWIYNIAIRGNDLYLLTVSALYLVKDGVTKREGLQAQRLVWGIPRGHVHQCFHGMAIGPEGDIYFASGDPLWYYGDFTRPDHWGHWTYFFQPEGSSRPFTGVGGVMRCRPDGTRLQVVSRGQRNSCGLTFDNQWNLFSNDNDHEGMPAEFVPGRLLHVTPQGYFSWPRGWLLDKDSQRADLLETMNSNLGRFVPVGQTYYDETFFPQKYRKNLFVARWGTRSIPRYPLVSHGATFKVSEVPFLVGRDHARPVGVAVGRGGRLFATISYMVHNETSPVYPSDLVMITRADDPSTHPFDAYEATHASPEKLWFELSNASWWRRYRAHTEILRRGGKLLDEAVQKLKGTGNEDPARGHLVWLAGANRSEQAAEGLVQLTRHEDDKLRLQAVRALSEYRQLGAPRKLFIELLSDQHPQVRHAALLALFDQEGAVPKQVIDGPARSRDTYLRQAAVLLLAQKTSLAQLHQLCQSRDQPTRLAGVLAAGFRLTLPPATEPIPEHLPLDASRQEQYVVQFADAKEDLRDYGRVGNFTVAEHWKVDPHTREQESLFALLKARLDDEDEQIRLQAAHFLFLLNDPRSEEKVAGVYRVSEELRLTASGIRKQVDEVWLVGPHPDGSNGFQEKHLPELGPVDLTARYPVGDRELTWRRVRRSGRLFNLREEFGPCDQSSFYAYLRLESSRRQPVMLLLGSDDGVKVWQNGEVVWENPVDRAALPYQDVVMLELQAGSNDMLVRVRNNQGACGLYLDYLTFRDVAVALPEALGSVTLAKRLREAGQSEESIPASFAEIQWNQESTRGDVPQGRQLFESLGCVKCHAIRASDEGRGGPSLSGSRKRLTVPYLVESILLPSKSVSPIFRETVLETVDGQIYNGLVVGETAQKIDLLLGDASRLSVEKERIRNRRLLDGSPMPHGLVTSPDELRDLLTYILVGDLDEGAKIEEGNR